MDKENYDKGGRERKKVKIDDDGIDHGPKDEGGPERKKVKIDDDVIDHGLPERKKLKPYQGDAGFDADFDDGMDHGLEDECDQEQTKLKPYQGDAGFGADSDDGMDDGDDEQEKVSMILENLRELKNLERVIRVFEIVETEDLNTIERVLQGMVAFMKIKEPTIQNPKSLLQVAIEYREHAMMKYSKYLKNVIESKSFDTPLPSDPTRPNYIHESFTAAQLFSRLVPEMTPRCNVISVLETVNNEDLSSYFSLQFIKFAIKNNANVNGKDGFGNSPLHLLAMKQIPHFMEILRLLIDNGADIDALDNRKRTSLHVAATNLPRALFHEIVSYLDLIKRTNSFAIACSNGSTVLHCAVFTSEILTETLDIFKKNGADFNALTNYDESILKNAIRGGRSSEFIQYLTQLGAVWKPSQNDTPLHYAAFWGNLSAVKLFIQQKCDVNAKNARGHTPLHNVLLSETDGTHAIVTELVNNRANVGLENNRGNTPVDLANKLARNGKIEERSLQLLLMIQNLHKLKV